jgi:hypothetical protein
LILDKIGRNGTGGIRGDDLLPLPTEDEADEFHGGSICRIAKVGMQRAGEGVGVIADGLLTCGHEGSPFLIFGLLPHNSFTKGATNRFMVPPLIVKRPSIAATGLT